MLKLGKIKTDIVSGDEVYAALEKEAKEWCKSKDHVKGFDESKLLNAGHILNDDIHIVIDGEDDKIPFTIGTVNGDFGVSCYGAEQNKVFGWESFPGTINGRKFYVYNLYGIKSFEGCQCKFGATRSDFLEMSFILPGLESFKGIKDLTDRVASSMYLLSIEAKNKNLSDDFIQELAKVAYDPKCVGIELRLHPDAVKNHKKEIDDWRWRQFPIQPWLGKNNTGNNYKIFVSD